MTTNHISDIIKAYLGGVLDQRDFQLWELHNYPNNSMRYIENYKDDSVLVYFKGYTRTVYLPKNAILQWVGKYELDKTEEISIANITSSNPMTAGNHVQFTADRNSAKTKLMNTPPSQIKTNGAGVPVGGIAGGKNGLFPPGTYITPPPYELKLPDGFEVATDGCNHSWKSYTGLSETYDYCEHCDVKK